MIVFTHSVKSDFSAADVVSIKYNFSKLKVPIVMIFTWYFKILKCNDILYGLNTLSINLPIHTYRRSTTIRVEYILNYNNT